MVQRSHCRQSRKNFFIIRGRSLVKKMQPSQHCCKICYKSDVDPKNKKQDCTSSWFKKKPKQVIFFLFNL
jgi:hypothetical protein